MLSRLLERGRSARLVADIELNRKRRGACALRCPMRGSAIDVGDSHGSACIREQLTGSGTEPAAAAGDEHEPALEWLCSAHAAAAMPTCARSARLPHRTAS